MSYTIFLIGRIKAKLTYLKVFLLIKSNLLLLSANTTEPQTFLFEAKATSAACLGQTVQLLRNKENQKSERRQQLLSFCWSLFKDLQLHLRTSMYSAALRAKFKITAEPSGAA